MASRGELQQRIDALLGESPHEPWSSFSAYLDSAKDLVDELWGIVDGEGDADAAIARALDRAEALATTTGRHRLRHAVEAVVTNHPRVHGLGLRVPDLDECAPHLTLPQEPRRR